MQSSKTSPTSREEKLIFQKEGGINDFSRKYDTMKITPELSCSFNHQLCYYIPTHKILPKRFIFFLSFSCSTISFLFQKYFSQMHSDFFPNLQNKMLKYFCENNVLQTANMSALFPCGDSMVCIIDDRFVRFYSVVDHQLFMRLLIRSFLRSYIRSFIRSCMRSLIRSFINSIVHMDG